MTPQVHTEEDFPKGHPARFDYDPASPEAKEWRRRNVNLKGERDFPVGHIKAVDTPGNTNHIPVRPGIDPRNPHLEEFTGSTPEVAAGRKAAQLELAKQQLETPMTEEGFVNTAQIAEQSAVDFLVKQGHDETIARDIVRREGVDQILAAKATMSAEE